MATEHGTKSDRGKLKSSSSSVHGPQTKSPFAKEQPNSAHNSPPVPDESVSARAREEDTARAVHLICGKWGIHILSQLAKGVVRPGRLWHSIPGISRKMVTDVLHQLESSGLVEREDLSQRVLHVQYRLRAEVHPALLPLLNALAEFGAMHRELHADDSRTRAHGEMSPPKIRLAIKGQAG